MYCSYVPDIESLVQFVFDNATRGHAESFIKTVDAFPLELMTIGEEKGLLMENLIAQKKPKVRSHFRKQGHSSQLV